MNHPQPRGGPLAGVRILDFTHVLSGAFASQLLGDMGAEIIKIEPPGGEAVRRSGPPFQGGESAYFLSYNRNKRSLVLDLKKPEGIELVKRLLPRMDVFMENFRPGVMERLGLGEAHVRTVKPDIVYGSLTAFSRHSSFRDKPGFELIIQGLSGIVDVTTPVDSEPAKIQLQIVDMCTGMYLALGVLGALYDRAVTGTARRVDTSLMEATMAMTANLAGILFMTGSVPTGMGTRNPQLMPSQAFATRDGYVTVVAGIHWSRFCAALGKPGWLDDTLMSDGAARVEHYAESEARIGAVIREKTTAEWLEIFEHHEVAAGPVNSMEQAFAHPAVTTSGIVQSVEHPSAGTLAMLSSPLRFSGQDRDIARAPPRLGEHTVEILREAGYDETEIRSMLDHEVVQGLDDD